MSKRSRNQNASIMNNKNLTENKIISSLALQLTVYTLPKHGKPYQRHRRKSYQLS